MNLQKLISDFTNTDQTQGAVDNRQATTSSGGGNLLDSIGSALPGGLAGGAAAGGLMALLMGSKSTRKMAKKVVKYGGTAVLGGLAYKAYGNWQKNKALGQTQPVTERDMQTGADRFASLPQPNHEPLQLVLIKAMVAASKADGNLDSEEQQRLFSSMEKLELSPQDKASVFDMLGRDISVSEITESVTLDEHKAEVYLAAYLAIEVDDQRERAFLNDLAISMALPKGLPAYLEQQADQGIAP